MRRFVASLCVAVLLAGGAVALSAQGPQQTPGFTHIPESTIERLADIGVLAHTNHLIRVDPQATGTRPTGKTPGGLWPIYAGVNSLLGFGTGVIVIVDAFHYGTSLNDFNVFARQFQLPTEPSTSATSAGNQVFQVVYASGRQPRSNCGWAQEAALDIEWAHAMAPNAKIVLVEAASNSFTDLFTAVDVATGIITKSGANGQVSMSWGGSEFSSETSFDSHFLGSGVVYFASSGDTGGATIYPSVSPNVVAAGGTTLVSATNESAWSGSGGGPSKYEPRPSFQDGISSITGSHRGSPDLSFDANPSTGVSVYDSTSCQGFSGWMVFGGTSVSSPSLAGLVNSAGAASSSAAQLATIYKGLGTSNFFDITSGSAGTFNALIGWDFITGVGSPRGFGGL